MSIASYLSDTIASSVDFSTYIDRYKDTLRTAFRRRLDLDAQSLKRGFPSFLMRQVQSCTPLSVFIPATYGGRGAKVSECLSVLEASSYESLALSLTMGINGALFLQPVSKYGQEDVKAEAFRRFLQDKALGGLMITEPEYGSDALSMQTSFTQEGNAYVIQGTKQWAGLTGMADFWLLTARERDAQGNLGRDVGFFVCDAQQPEQHIEVEEYFNNLGLYFIPYGRNRVNVRVPAVQRLEPKTTGIKMMLDLLHRSRMQFPGMGMGYLRRMLDEAVQHCRERYVGGQSLFNYDQVKERLARLQAYYTSCSAMCAYASEHASTERELATESIPANAIKTVVTDFMQEASQSLLQLTGAKGYRLDHIAGRSTVDSRPFQIFEGSNDILYQQISEGILKLMRRSKETNLHAFLSSYALTSRAAEYFKDTLNFNVDLSLPQRKLVDLGQLLGRVITMEFTIDLGSRGFHSDLISNALTVLRQDVDALVTRVGTPLQPAVVEDYTEDSGWLQYTRA
ncbi:MAG: acyl-CoA dehydrogenase family protein [Bacteroidota bacterium]